MGNDKRRTKRREVNCAAIELFHKILLNVYFLHDWKSSKRKIKISHSFICAKDLTQFRPNCNLK